MPAAPTIPLTDLDREKVALVRQITRGIWQVPDAELEAVVIRVHEATDAADLDRVREWMRAAGY